MHVLVAISMVMVMVMAIVLIVYALGAVGLGVLWCIDLFGLYPVVGSLVLINAGIAYVVIHMRHRRKRVDEAQ